MPAYVEEMFSVREKPWHYEMTKDRTHILSEAPTSRDAIELAGLNWIVESKPVFDEKGNEIKDPNKGHFIEFKIIKEVQFRGNSEYASEYYNKFAGEKTFEIYERLW